MNDREIQKMLRGLALETVCPLTLVATTIYEKGMVKNYIRFGNLTLKRFSQLSGYSRMGAFKWAQE